VVRLASIQKLRHMAADIDHPTETKVTNAIVQVVFMSGASTSYEWEILFGVLNSAIDGVLD
jgi:hypothetical protein